MSESDDPRAMGEDRVREPVRTEGAEFGRRIPTRRSPVVLHLTDAGLTHTPGG